MKNLVHHILGYGGAGALLVACFLAGPSAASEQQTQKVSLPAVSGKYTQQFLIDVDDAPAHMLRLSELHRTYDANAPQIAGTRLKESWSRTLADYVDLNGDAVVYSTYVFENGDKFFCKGTLTAQKTTAPSGSSAAKYLATLHITRGTGKLLGIRGVVRLDASLNVPAAANQSRGGDIEYWFDTGVTSTASSPSAVSATSTSGR